MDEVVIYICLGLLYVFGILSVMLKSITKSAIALAAGSATLGIIMYTLGYTWAALFEISVCSGLVTVIFISAISLSNTDKKDIERVFDDTRRMSLLPFVLIAAGVILVTAALASGVSLPSAGNAEKAVEDLREILWNNRQADIWGQVIVMIAGSLAVVVLYKERDSE